MVSSICFDTVGMESLGFVGVGVGVCDGVVGGRSRALGICRRPFVAHVVLRCEAVESSAENTVSKFEEEGDGEFYCPECGKGGKPGGCDGTGRIIGGIGAVLKWWPIKAYRPCPGYVKHASYRRSGQSLVSIQ